MTTLELIKHKYHQPTTIYNTFKYLPLLPEVVQIKTPLLTHINNNPYPQQIDQLNHDIWTTNADYNGHHNNNNDDEGNDLLVQAQVTSLFEEILYILNESAVDQNDLDDNFMKYLKYASDAVQVILNSMFDNVWTFSPMEKFMCIYMMLASRYEPRAIKYLFNSPYFIESSITKKDKYGYSPLLQAILNNNFDIKILESYLTLEKLSEPCFYDIPLVVYSVLNTKTFMQIIDRFDITTIQYENFASMLILSIIYNEEVARIIIEQPKLLSAMINQKDVSGITCLIHSLVKAPELFKLLMESECCTQELVNTPCEQQGNILSIAVKQQPLLVDFILESKYMNHNLMHETTTYKYGNKKNILLESLHDTETFKKIITNKYFNKDLIFYLYPELYILNEIISENFGAFELLIEHQIITSEMLTMKDSNEISPLILMSLSHIHGLELCINKNLIKKEHISIKYKNRNLLMLLLQNTNSSYICVYKLYEMGYIDHEILSMRDKNSYNTFWYVCRYYPNLATVIMETNKNIYLDNSTLRSILYSASTNDNYELVEKLIAQKLIKLDNVNQIDSYGNNIFMESCIYESRLAGLLITNNLVSQETFNAININGDNFLTLLLKYSWNPDNELAFSILKCVLVSGFMNSDIMNIKNSYGESPFLLSCRLDSSYVKLIMESEYFNEESFSLNTCSGTNCFVYACNSGNYELLEMICNHKSFTESMFTSYDVDDIPYIYYGMLGNYEMMKYIVNHKYCNPKLLSDTYKLLLTKNKLTCKILELIIESSNCTIELLQNTDIGGNNCLAICVSEDEIEVIKKIFELPYFTNELFMHQNKVGLTMLAADITEPMLDTILSSSKFNPDILLLKDNENLNMIDNYLENSNFNLVCKILESGKCPIDVLKSEPSNILVNMFSYNDSITDTIFKMENVTNDDLCYQDKNGNTCLHMCARKMLDLQLHNVGNSITENLNKMTLLITKYINSDKFSEKLFETKNNNGNTFLLLNPHLIKIVLTSKYCTKKLLKALNEDGKTIFVLICGTHKEYFDDFINHKLFDASFLINVYKTEITSFHMLAHICMTDHGDILDKILASSVCTNEIINYVDGEKYTPLAYAIIAGNIQTINKLLNSEFDLTPSFNVVDKYNRNILMMASLMNHETFSLIIKSKYVTKDMFFHCDKYKHNVLIYALNKDIDTLKLIVESDFWSNSLMYYTDIDNDFVMMYPYDKPDIVKYLLDLDRCDTMMVQMTNNVSKNCSHYYAQYNDISLGHLLESKLCTAEIINYQDISGETCLHLASKHNVKSLMKLIDSKYMTHDLILKQNNKGQNALMLLLVHNPFAAIDLYRKFMDFDQLLWQTDKGGKNLLFYALRYNTKLLRIILKASSCTNNKLTHKNINGMTCYMYAGKHNGNALKFLLKHKDTSNEMLFFDHLDYGSALTLAAKYQPEGVKHLLSWKPLSWKVVSSLFQKKNFVSIACTYNSIAVKYAIDSAVDLSEFFEKRATIDNPFFNACRFQPEAVKYILDSKYGSKQLILNKIEGRSCLEEAYDLQPKALMYILKSKYNCLDFLNNEDERGYRLINRIKTVFSDINTIEDIGAITLTHHDNTVAADKNSKSCDICLTYKSAVVFLPCFHMCCVGCAFKLRKCHQCRSMIENRKVINN